MFCKKCGSPLEPTDAFCKNCGEPVNTQNPVAEAAPLTQPTAPVETPAVPTPVPTESVTPSVVNPVSGGDPVAPMSTAPAEAPVTPTPEPAPMPTPAPTEPATPTVAPVAATAPTEAPKKNKTFIIIAIVLVAIIIVLGGILIAKKFAGKDNVNSNTTNDQNVVNPVNDDNTNTNTNTYEFKDYQLPIPNGYTPTITDSNGNNILQIVNKSSTVMARIELYQGMTVDDIKAIKDDLKPKIETGIGVNISSIEEKNYSGIDWIIYNASMEYNGETFEIYYTYCNVGSYTIAENYIIDGGDLSKDQILTDLSNMYKNTTYKGTKNFSPSDKPKEIKPTIAEKFDTSIFN